MLYLGGGNSYCETSGLEVSNAQLGDQFSLETDAFGSYSKIVVLMQKISKG